LDFYIGFHGMRYKPVVGSVLQGNNHPEVNCLSDKATAHLLEWPLHVYECSPWTN